MLEAIEGGLHFLREIAVAGRELIAKDMQEAKIDLVGTMGIRGMDLGAAIRRIINRAVCRQGLLRNVVCHDGVEIFLDIMEVKREKQELGFAIA